MKILLFDIKPAIKYRLDALETLSQRHNRHGQVTSARDACFQEDSDDICAPTQFLQMHKNQLNDLQEYLERYFNVLPVFSINSVNNDIKLIKSFLLLKLINWEHFEPVFIKKTN